MPISDGRVRGCALCAYLERGDVLYRTDRETRVEPVWISNNHSITYPADVDFEPGFYRVEIQYGHLCILRVDEEYIDEVETPFLRGYWGLKRPLSKYMIVDADHRKWWSIDEHTNVLEHASTDELLKYVQPAPYAHHHLLSPAYWSLVVDHYREFRKRTRVLSNDDELLAFYGRTTLADSLELFSKWEFLGHDYDLRWARNVPLKYQLIRSNLIRNPTLPYSWPIHAVITANPPGKVYERGGGAGQYLETFTELIEGSSVRSMFSQLSAGKIYRIGIECLAILHEAHYGAQAYHWMHLDPHLDNFLLANEKRGQRMVKLLTMTITLTEPLWLIDYNSAYFPDFPTEFVAADFAYANEQEGWYRRYTTINPAWDFIYFMRNYWWLIASTRPELLQHQEFQQFFLKSLRAIPEQLLMFAGKLNPLDRLTELRKWFYSLLGMTEREVQEAVVNKATTLLSGVIDEQFGEWVKAWFGSYRDINFIGQRRLSIGNGTIGSFLERLLNQ